MPRHNGTPAIRNSAPVRNAAQRDTDHVPAVVEAGNTFADAVENHRRQAKERARSRISGIIILPGAPARRSTRQREDELFRTDPPGAGDVDHLVIGADALDFEVRLRLPWIGRRNRVSIVQ